MWITVQESDVLSRMAGPEVVALQTKALGANQTDPIPEVIAEVMDEIRGFIGAHPSNLPMGSGITIPSKLKGSALSIIVHRVASRLPTKILMTDERIHAKSDALALLHEVARGMFKLDRPDPNQIDRVEVVGNVYGSVNNMGRHKRFSPRDQRGI
jgi:hypothetical protein